jgi:hypothetical protein
MHDMRARGGMNLELQTFLTLELDGDERSASRLGSFIPGERIDKIKRQAEEKKSYPTRESIHNSSGVQTVA